MISLCQRRFTNERRRREQMSLGEWWAQLTTRLSDRDDNSDLTFYTVVSFVVHIIILGCDTDYYMM